MADGITVMALQEVIANLKADLAERDHTLDIIRKADERGADLWRAVNPGKELTIPDRGILICWMLDQLDEFRKATGLEPAGGWQAVTPDHLRSQLEGLERRAQKAEKRVKALEQRAPKRKGTKVRAGNAGGATSADHKAMDAAIKKAARRKRVK